MAVLPYIIRTKAGTKTAPAHSYTAETDSGWYRQSAGAIRLSVDDTDVILASSTGIIVSGVFNATGLVTASAGVKYGADVTLTRGIAHRLDLATGDSFNVINGDVTVSGDTKLTNNAEGGTGAVTQKTARQVVAMGTGATAVSTSISVPTGARLIAVALNVDVAIVNAGNNTWSAAFSTGSTTAIASAGTAAAQNTKITLMLDDEITTGTTEITFTPQAANFTSGSIEAVVWYEELTALANA